MKTLLIATHNPGKLAELKQGLKPLEQQGIKIVSLSGLNITQQPEETGLTFEANALLKAKFYAGLTQLPIVADDGGLGIDILAGEPGVKSRLWLNREASDEELIAYTLKRLIGFPKGKRTGSFTTCVCFFDPQTNTTFFETEAIYGYFVDKPSSRRIIGYPFRSLFVVKGLNKYYDELTNKEHDRINHRLKAARRLVKKIEKYLLQ